MKRETDKDKYQKSKEKSINLAVVNVRGYMNNQTAIEELLNKEIYDVIILTETWLKKKPS